LSFGLFYPTVPVAVGGLAFAAAFADLGGTRDGGWTASRIVSLVGAVAAILAITLVPTPGPNELQLVPIVDLFGLQPSITGTDVVAETIGNAILFAPLGASMRRLGLSLRSAALIGLVFSSSIELTQLAVPGRTTSTDDVIFNTLGAVLGYAAISLRNL
jgi:glycopeptide antibiotics resistance protein